MARSFDLVDDKLFEADFFLEKLAECDPDWSAARHYVSAFISAARSVTFALQGCVSDLEGFAEWYAEKQAALRANPIARFFGKARTDSQHLGVNLLNSRKSIQRPDGTFEHLYYFGAFGSELPDCPQTDAVTACREYLTLLVGLVFDCYERFGASIDPALYYTVENLRRLGLTVEDVEESFGFPRGWTAVPEAPDEVRLRFLKREAGATAVDSLFAKYLGRSRSGKPPGQ